MSTWFLRQATHMLAGFGSIRTPHSQHKLGIKKNNEHNHKWFKSLCINLDSDCKFLQIFLPTYILDSASWDSCLTRLLASMYSIFAVNFIYCSSPDVSANARFYQKEWICQIVCWHMWSIKHIRVSKWDDCNDIYWFEFLKNVWERACITFYNQNPCVLCEWHHSPYQNNMFSRNKIVRT